MGVREGETATYTVVLDTAPTGTVTVTLTSSNPDVTPSPATLTFNVSGTKRWNVPQTVTVSAAEDMDLAHDSSMLTHTASGGGYDGVTADSFTVSVIDNDTASLVLSTEELTVMEGGSSTYTVRLALRPSNTVTVTPSLRTPNPDITVDPASLSFSTSDWSIPQTVRVSARHDADKLGERAMLDHAAAGGGYDGVTGTVDVAVADDEGACGTKCVRISPNGAIAEGDNATFTLHANPAPTRDLKVRVFVEDLRSTFLLAGDRGTRTVTLPAHQAAVVIRVPTQDDAKDEPNGWILAQARRFVGNDQGYAVQKDSQGQLGLQQALVAVSDNDAPPAPETGLTKFVTFTLSQATIEEDAADPWVDVDISLSEPHTPAGPPGSVTPVLDSRVCFSGSARRSRNLHQTGDNGYDYRVWVTEDIHGEIAERIDGGACSSASFKRGETQARMRIEILDDDHEDSGETIRVGMERVDLPKWRRLGVGIATPLTTLVILNDEGATLPAGHPVVKYGSLVKSFHARITAQGAHGNGARGGWNKRFLKAMGHPDYVDYPQAAVTVADATRLWNHGGPGANTAWNGTVEAVTYAERYFAGQVTTPDPAPVPEIAIAAGADVTEGTAATFVLTANPAPAAPLDVTVTVATEGDYGITAGERTVTIPVSGSTTLTLATTGDDADEPDGSVSATLAAGDGYTVGTASSGTVAIADDDVPEITIAAGAGVTESTAASFTLTANPAPAAPLDVTVTVAADGDYGITAGTRTVTIPTTGSYELTLSTAGDDADEADGSVSATVDAGSGYTVGSASSGTVAIADDDAPGSVLPAAHPVIKYAALVKSFHDRITAQGAHGNGARGGWNKRFLKAMGHSDYVDYPQAAVTVADATRLWNHGGPGANTAWNGTVEAVTYAEQYFAGQVTAEDEDTTDPAPAPEITIAAGADVTEGTAATFVLTADPVPTAPLDVTVTVAADGAFGITAGERMVTIPVSGSFTLTLATAGDDADEPDGAVSATVAAGTGYTVGSASSGTVAIADDDLPPPAADPEVTIAAGSGVTEGTAASFVLTASPAPTAPLDVTVTVATDGAFGITAGERTVTIPTAGSTTLTLATTGDDTDEPDGSVSATVTAGTGYTVGSASSGTVAIADDDLPPPAVSVSGGDGITEGGDALFTVTADRAVAADLAVTLNVAEAAGPDRVDASIRRHRNVPWWCC
ncbi:MAG: hypothetical protein F4X42_12115 [Rhodospirillaceae bacterium]|nr:hypothetical protein [Rhodospirillaceae bacterium]MYB13983.1 hypothetical protein [Rhodospirillaceae bacterium]